MTRCWVGVDYIWYVWKKVSHQNDRFLSAEEELLCPGVLVQWSARLSLHSQDRYQDYVFLSLKYETETQDRDFDETFFWLFWDQDRDWKFHIFETETETDTETDDEHASELE